MIRTLTTNRFSPYAAVGAFGSALSVSALLNKLEAWSALARQRRALAGLDAARLRDLGLSADQAAHEAARPFWEAPQGR